MQRVSTNATIFLKIFVPTFWIVFFGAVTAAVWANKAAYYGNIPGGPFRLGVLLFFVSGLAMFALTLMRLKRVEFSADHLFVTNYFKHFQYPFSDVAAIYESQFAGLKIVTIELKAPGSFGKRFSFVASTRLYEDFWLEHPALKARLAGKGV